MRAKLLEAMSNWTLRPRRMWFPLVLAIFAVFLVVQFVYRSSLTTFGLVGGAPPRPQVPTDPPPPTFEVFGIQNLAAELQIATVHVTTNYTDKVPTLSKIPARLPNFARLQIDGLTFDKTNPISDEHASASSVHVAVNVERPLPPRGASKVIFGVATTLSRLSESLRGFKYWAAHTGARFVIIVEPHSGKDDEPTVAEALEMYTKEGVNLTLVESKMGYIDRYVALLGVLHEHMEPQTEWVSLIDDDTFFFNMRTLLHALDKYPINESYWIGAVSENKWNINEGGITPVGGAGIFMTRNLINELAPHADECVKLPNGAGDGRVSDCIIKYLTTKLTLEYGLWQLDIHGDVTGFYEAARPQPISVHHWRSWHHHDIPAVSTVGKVCGRACVFQSFDFLDGWRMTNGFSIVKYGYDKKELAEQIEAAMEHTWEKTIWVIPTSWRYSFEPLKPKDPNKIQYLMEKVEEDKKAGTMTLYYVRRKGGGGSIGDSIIRVIWKKPTLEPGWDWPY
jgi:hypothetical protein